MAKWVYIATGIFSDEKILLIESMPSADSIIVIWFKLLMLAASEFPNRIPYTDEKLSTIFRRDLNTVRLALRTFEQFGMIEIDDDVINIPELWARK